MKKIISILLILVMLSFLLISINVSAVEMEVVEISASQSKYFTKNNEYHKAADRYIPDGYCDVKTIVSYFKEENGFRVDFIRGDVNLDGHCNIKDVTAIQKNIAQITEFNITQLFAADVYASNIVSIDNEINIQDATFIQKKIANLPLSEKDLYYGFSYEVAYTFLYKPYAEGEKYSLFEYGKI